MTADLEGKCDVVSGVLQVQSAIFNSDKIWHLQCFDQNRLLIESNSNGKAMSGSQAGLGWLSSETYVALLQGLVVSRYNGVLSLDFDDCIKRLYFQSGELIFAGSSLIDDRLGEVLYRHGRITLDQLTEAAVQVSRVKKFGRVLLEAQVLTSSQLWESLKIQVLDIFQSTFLYERSFVKLEPGSYLAPTAISIGKSTESLIDESRAFSEIYRQFRKRLDKTSVLKGVESVFERQGIEAGTFSGDILAQITSHPGVFDFLAHSKLRESTTISAVLDHVHRQLLRVENFDVSMRGLDLGPEIKSVKSLIDAYDVIIDGAKKAFFSEGLTFPVQEIELFMEDQYSLVRSPIFISHDCTVSPVAIIGMYAAARSNVRRADFVASQMKRLILFVLQVIGDFLPGNKGWDMKLSYMKLIT